MRLRGREPWTRGPRPGSEVLGFLEAGAAASQGPARCWRASPDAECDGAVLAVLALFMTYLMPGPRAPTAALGTARVQVSLPGEGPEPQGAPLYPCLPLNPHGGLRCASQLGFLLPCHLLCPGARMVTPPASRGPQSRAGLFKFSENHSLSLVLFLFPETHPPAGHVRWPEKGGFKEGYHQGAPQPQSSAAAGFEVSQSPGPLLGVCWHTPFSSPFPLV